MTLKLFQDGDVLYGSELNNSYNELLNISGKNLIRTLIDRGTTFSGTTDDWFSEAYIDSNGRVDTVNTTSSITTATFSSNKYMNYTQISLAGMTESSSISGPGGHPTTITNISNFYDDDNATYSSWTYGTGGSASASIITGKLFGSTITVNRVYVKATSETAGTPGSSSIVLQTYDGATWTDKATLASSGTTSCSCDGYFDYTPFSSQGIRVQSNPNDSDGSSFSLTAKFYTLKVFTSNESNIVHTIPANKFGSTINTAYLSPLIADWNTGANVQYKLTNTTEDTGWLNYGSVQSFTAFTSTPTTLTVKLVAASTAASAGYPSIYGVALRAA